MRVQLHLRAQLRPSVEQTLHLATRSRQRVREKLLPLLDGVKEVDELLLRHIVHTRRREGQRM